jgi:hypothetical protein
MGQNSDQILILFTIKFSMKKIRTDYNKLNTLKSSQDFQTLNIQFQYAWLHYLHVQFL